MNVRLEIQATICHVTPEESLNADRNKTTNGQMVFWLGFFFLSLFFSSSFYSFFFNTSDLLFIASFLDMCFFDLYDCLFRNHNMCYRSKSNYMISQVGNESNSWIEMSFA